MSRSMWLLGRLAPDHKTIADFRKDNGLALRKLLTRSFVKLCLEMGLISTHGERGSERRRTTTYWTTACQNCSLKSQCYEGCAATPRCQPASHAPASRDR